MLVASEVNPLEMLPLVGGISGGVLASRFTRRKLHAEYCREQVGNKLEVISEEKLSFCELWESISSGKPFEGAPSPSA